MGDVKKNRDTGIELLRIIGALMVIGTHIALDPMAGGAPSRARILVSCLVSDGVAIFFFICGFFLFAGKAGYGARLKKLCTRILVPLLLYSVFSFFFYGIISGEASSLSESFRHTSEDMKNIFISLLKWQNAIPGAGHMWYLYVYSILIFVFPALKGIRDLAVSSRNGYKILLVVLFLLLVINDLTFNGLFGFSHHAFNGCMAAAILVFFGDAMGRKREQIRGDRSAFFLGLLMFVGGVVLRSCIQYQCYLLDNPTNEPLFWYTSYSVVTVTGISLMVLAIKFSGPDGLLSRIISHLGKLTFPVYIVHEMCMFFFNHRGIKEIILSHTGDNGIGVFLYEAAYVLLIFVTASLISEVIIFIKNSVIIKTFKSIKKGER